MCSMPHRYYDCDGCLNVGNLMESTVTLVSHSVSIEVSFPLRVSPKMLLN